MPSRRRDGGRLFVSGGLFEWIFTLPVGRMRFTATVLTRGTDLELWDAEFFPAPGGRLAIGVSGIRRLIDEFCDLAHADGLDIVRLSGYRMSGSSPGRDSDMRIVCRRSRSHHGV
jgi:hypothetical protein